MINSIKHALDIINSFSIQTPELGITDLASKLDMNASTVHHIVKTLYAEGVLVKTQSRKYRLGSPLLDWGRLVSEQYKAYFMTIPYLETLAKKENETIHFAIIENDEVSYLAKVEGATKPIRVVTNIGLREPLYGTAMGKVLLAYQSKKMVQKVCDTGVKDNSANASTDSHALLKELHMIREQGYAAEIEKEETDYLCIAAPIRDIMGNVVCAISVSGPETRISGKKLSIIQNLFKTAQNISDYCDLM